MHPLKHYFMGTLLNSIGSNIQDMANGALSSLIGGSISNGFSKSMMRYQDKLNDQNALDAYNRQRELMGDSASLQKQGMLKAGYNTAFGSNGSVMSAGSSQMSSVGQSGMGNSMPNSFQTLLDAKEVESNAKVNDSHSKLLDSQRVGQDIENDYKVANILSDIDNKVADTRDKNSKARGQELKNYFLNKYGDRQEGATTGILENQEAESAENAAIAGINRQIEQSTRPDKEAYAHELVENEKKKGKLLDAQVVTENGKVLVQQSEVAKNYADANLSNKKAEQTSLDTEFARDTYSDREETIRLDNKFKDLQTIPHKLSEILIRSKVGRSVVTKLENGQTLSPDEIKYLKSLEFRNGVDENTFSGWIKMLIGLTAKD